AGSPPGCVCSASAWRMTMIVFTPAGGATGAFGSAEATAHAPAASASKIERETRGMPAACRTDRATVHPAPGAPGGAPATLATARGRTYDDGVDVTAPDDDRAEA